MDQKGYRGDPAALLSPATLPSSGPVAYSPSLKRILITGAGSILDGYDLRDTFVNVNASNVTIKNCVGNAMPESQGYNNIVQYSPHSGLSVENCTFDGDRAPSRLTSFVSSRGGELNVKASLFRNVPNTAVDSAGGGLIENNSFLGSAAASLTFAHALSISTPASPLVIRDNFFDWRKKSGSLAQPDSAIKITGSAQNGAISVEENQIFGGRYAIRFIDSPNPLGPVTLQKNRVLPGSLGSYLPAVLPGSVQETGTLPVSWEADVLALSQDESLTGPLPGTVTKKLGVDPLPAGAGFNPSTKRLNINVAGVVLDGWDLRGAYLTVSAANVTIRNSVLNTAGLGYSIVDVGTSGPGRLAIERCLFDGEGRATNAAGAVVVRPNSSATIRNARIKGMPSDDIVANGDLHLVDSYLSVGGFGSPSAHFDTITIAGTNGQLMPRVLILGNYLDNRKFGQLVYGINNNLRIASPSTGTPMPIVDLQIERNVLDRDPSEASYPFQILNNPQGVADIRFADNLVTPNQVGSYYHPYTEGGAISVWRGMLDTRSLAPISAPQPLP